MVQWPQTQGFAVASPVAWPKPQWTPVSPKGGASEGEEWSRTPSGGWVMAPGHSPSEGRNLSLLIQAASSAPQTHCSVFFSLIKQCRGGFGAVMLAKGGCTNYQMQVANNCGTCNLVLKKRTFIEKGSFSPGINVLQIKVGFLWDKGFFFLIFLIFTTSANNSRGHCISYLLCFKYFEVCLHLCHLKCRFRYQSPWRDSPQLCFVAMPYNHSLIPM